VCASACVCVCLCVYVCVRAGVRVCVCARACSAGRPLARLAALNRPLRFAPGRNRTITRTNAHTHTYAHTRTRTHALLHTHTHTEPRTHARTHPYTHNQRYTYTDTHTRTPVYTHTHSTRKQTHARPHSNICDKSVEYGMRTQHELWYSVSTGWYGFESVGSHGCSRKSTAAAATCTRTHIHARTHTTRTHALARGTSALPSRPFFANAMKRSTCAPSNPRNSVRETSAVSPQPVAFVWASRATPRTHSTSSACHPPQRRRRHTAQRNTHTRRVSRTHAH
jgi:hypothetical protein